MVRMDDIVAGVHQHCWPGGASDQADLAEDDPGDGHPQDDHGYVVAQALGCIGSKLGFDSAQAIREA